MIWRGWGILVLIITIVMLIIMQGITGIVFGDSQYYAAHSWVKGVACILSAGTVYFIGRYLNNRNGRIAIDKSTGQEFELKRRHDFFFIHMQYWSIPLAIGGIVLIFIK